jgi:hypothetical protein
VWDSGNNDSTGETAGTVDVITITEGTNAKSGVADLDDGSDFLKSRDISPAQTWYGSSSTDATLVSVGFKFTHAAGNDLSTTADFAIAADFCNFDQNNGSLTQNCIYRLEAEETGNDTGVFVGEVEYITLNNSTTGGTISGEHDGNDHEVEGLLATNSDELTIVLSDSSSGSDAPRVIYNDTDALQASDKVGAQLDTATHTGTVDLDLDDYEEGDMATITIVDADLNQDSSIRDTYQNSSTTFNVTATGSDGIAEQKNKWRYDYY